MGASLYILGIYIVGVLLVGSIQLQGVVSIVFFTSIVPETITL